MLQFINRSVILVTACLAAPLSQAVVEDKMYLSGGQTSIKASGRNAFSMPAANMPMTERLNFSVGNSFFRNPWVIAPATTTARDGLGPLFNTNACQNCHIKDGRGHLPEPGSHNSVSMLVRLSIPSTKADADILLKQGMIAEPNYGGQLQDFSIPGVKPEGQITFNYRYHEVTLADGEKVELREPLLTIDKLNYGPLHDKVQLSLRLSPPMIGLGLLEAVSDETLLALAASQPAQGVSGRPNKVWDVEKQKTVIGRFGWKAGQPTLRQQNAAAFNGDIGLTSSLFLTDECSEKQKDCRRSPSGNGDADSSVPELSDNLLEQVTFYTHNLAVPAQRNRQNPEVILGRQIFNNIGCASCHTETLKTANSPFPWLSHQTIHPYTDLLLHDMGPGLSDGRAEFIATGQEWRTPPLWGIGLSEVVSDSTDFLHDGRARNLTEAILWHGGEADTAKNNFTHLPKKERTALIRFLESL
ncbi:CxxC motif-containing protein (DUF1111 family) [Sinobacterium caligoides]|uniref:CxxC motif-containing protein (DUF1111 family) n=1 Tax=Sinobacterium caligoides TaxID=933926 RepID=A0A3N2DJH0_9GAMM|nr:di-heme oxidoredictase family protein [Sinobacterium caligoides]ROR99950.1 CxxC motif-containing protein (DUF1111 family) [Sinobacterium caligoides]